MPGQGQQRGRFRRGRYVQRPVPVLSAFHAQRRFDVTRAKVHGGRPVLVGVHFFEQSGPGIAFVPFGPAAAETDDGAAAAATATAARFARFELFGQLVESRGQPGAATTARANAALASSPVSPAGHRPTDLPAAAAGQSVAAHVARGTTTTVVRVRTVAATAATTPFATDALVVRIVDFTDSNVALHHLRVASYLQYVLDVSADRLYVARRVAHPGHVASNRRV